MEYALEISNLSKKIGKKEIVSDINLKIKYGETIGLIGANGAGKSTLIKCITGLWHYKNGNIKICGHTLKQEFKNCMLNMAAIVEYPKLFQNLTLLENINYFKSFYREYDPKKLNYWLDILSLNESKNKKIRAFSSGMHQKACLLIVMLRNPKLLILDEPTSMLDPKSAFEVRKFLEKLKQTGNFSMLISSHNLSEVESLCNNAIILDKGKITKTIYMADNNERKRYYTFIFENSTVAYELYNKTKDIYKAKLDGNNLIFYVDSHELKKIISDYNPSFLDLISNKTLEQEFMNFFGEK